MQRATRTEDVRSGYQEEAASQDSTDSTEDGEEPAELEEEWTEEWWCLPEDTERPPQLWRAAAEWVSKERDGD